MPELIVRDLDNRDLATTWLWINDTYYVEVNLFVLLQDAIDNLEERQRLSFQVLLDAMTNLYKESV